MLPSPIKVPAVAAALLLTILAGCSPPSSDVPVDLVIEHVTVIDPIAGQLDDQRVVIDDGLIRTVTPMPSDPSAAPIASGEVVDGTGRFLIPGLWDMHVHFLYDRTLTDIMPSLFLDYGVTSVRDTGGDLADMVALTKQLSTVDEPGPAIYFAGPLLDGRFVVYDGADPGRPKLGTGIPDAATASAYVRELKAAGADLIKIYELVDPAVYRVLADAARAAGLPIASHVPLMMTADQAGPLADSMEHLRNIELACAANWQALLDTRVATITSFIEGRGYDLRRQLHSLQRLPAIAAYDEARCDQVLAQLQSTIQVPTLRLNTVAIQLPFTDPGWPEALSALPEATRAAWQQNAAQLEAEAPLADRTFADWSLFLISRLLVNGVPIGAGTDTPIGLGIPGWSLHTELELLVEGGMSPLQALHAATIQAARFLHMEDQVGQIAPGMTADLLLLDGNPLEDIRNTRRINRVMQMGRWVRSY